MSQLKVMQSVCFHFVHVLEFINGVPREDLIGVEDGNFLCHLPGQIVGHSGSAIFGTGEIGGGPGQALNVDNIQIGGGHFDVLHGMQ